MRCTLHNDQHCIIHLNCNHLECCERLNYRLLCDDKRLQRLLTTLTIIMTYSLQISDCMICTMQEQREAASKAAELQMLKQKHEAAAKAFKAAEKAFQQASKVKLPVTCFTHPQRLQASDSNRMSNDPLMAVLSLAIECLYLSALSNIRLFCRNSIVICSHASVHVIAWMSSGVAYLTGIYDCKQKCCLTCFYLDVTCRRSRVSPLTQTMVRKKQERRRRSGTEQQKR